MRFSLRISLAFTATFTAILAFSPALSAQQSSNPASSEEFQPSRVDIFAGYSFIDPLSRTNGILLKPIDAGALGSASYYFSRHWGIQLEGGFHPDGPNECIYSGAAGPIYRFPLSGPFQPFLHAVGGAVKVGGPGLQPCTWGPGGAAGGGLDLGTHAFHNRLAIRLFQADFEYAHIDYGTAGALGLTGGTLNLHAARASAGLVLRLGSIAPPVPVGLSCSLLPAEAFPGDPVQIAATTSNVTLSGKKVPQWSWAVTGGVITGTSQNATVNTRGLAPGHYRVTAHLSDGPKPWESADCTADFTVMQFPPPTLTCEVNPNTVEPGEKAGVIAHGISTANRPLTYSFHPSGGKINGAGSVVALDTTGVLASGANNEDVNIDCTTTDDLGQSAYASTTLHVVAPPPVTKAGAPPTQPLCSLFFERDSRRPARVDNTAKACLDDVALSLTQQADARLVLIGESGEKEKYGEKLAAERALHARKYLTASKGIDPQRIELLTDSGKGQQVETVLVPQGATFDRTGTRPVREP
ncbi:MAG: OmpA family protein [Terriglobales bacterium]|jgi:hypothetical protein